MTEDRPVIIGIDQIRGIFPGSLGDVQQALAESVYDPAAESAGQDELGDLLAGAAVKLDEAFTLPGILAVADDQAASLLQSFLAEKALDEGRLEPTSDDLAAEVKMDERDARWIRAAGPWIREKMGLLKRHPRPEFSSAADTLPPKARLAILGDWGTGLYGAPHCANSISHDGAFAALVHLGDVYYSGTAREVQKRFLDLWPAVPGAVSRACNSNHEMYSGGGPYFTMTLPTFGQESSTFILENEYWMFVGLDTGYTEGRLGREQLEWLDRVVADREGRRLVLFSHHQPFSALSSQNAVLQGELIDLLESGHIFAWYWGHEHRLVLYDAHPRWGTIGRCVGHSGYPYFRAAIPGAGTAPLPSGQRFLLLGLGKDVPAARILDGPNPYVKRHELRYGPNGYVVLTIDGPSLVEEIRAPDGTVLHQSVLI